MFSTVEAPLEPLNLITGVAIIAESEIMFQYSFPIQIKLVIYLRFSEKEVFFHPVVEVGSLQE